MRTLPYLLTTLTAAAALAACGADTWTMPNLVGNTLQEAQDRVQALTDHQVDTRAHDQTGQHREQVSDRDWKVCGQSVAPGQSITDETEVDFAVVKTGEKCG